MASYEYRCTSCGRFEAAHPIGAAPEDADCPRCGQSGRRVFSAPMLGATAPRVDRLRAQEERSREAPDVARRLPPAPDRGPRPSNPLHARLPRP